MHKILIFNIFILFTLGSYAQHQQDSVIQQVLQNNRMLQALTQSTQADKQANKSGIFLQNPEAGFNYLWGSPEGVGNRIDWRVTQSIEFPTSYVFKHKMATAKNTLADAMLKSEEKNLVYETKLLCIQLTYLNARQTELNKQWVNAQKIVQSYKTKYDIGEANILEYNKAELNLLDAQQEMSLNEIERNAALSRLATLNAGNPLVYTDSTFGVANIPADFELWYSEMAPQNPEINEWKNETQLSTLEHKLAIAQTLPALEVGYMSEKTDVDQFSGLSVGISIPVWQNVRKIKSAGMKKDAVQMLENEKTIALHAEAYSLYQKAYTLNRIVNDYRQKMSSINSTELLLKTLERGEISLIQYITEISFYNEVRNKQLLLEKELHETLAELGRY